MARGLLWLPLLVAFIWLAWSGWNEYKKLEAYKIWAADFDNAKFDIYAVLGIKDGQITWGKPTRKGMSNLASFSLNKVQKINLLVGDKPISMVDNLPNKGKPVIEFELKDQNQTIKIPFTDISLAAKWTNYLQQTFD
ncbi:MAG: hypothetical protein ACRC80_05395 [Waterburya sp.]